MSQILRGLASRCTSTTTLSNRVSDAGFAGIFFSGPIRYLVLLIAACALPWCIQAQDATGKITGTITDPSGGVVPQAKITAINVETKVAKTAVTDTSGFYQIQPLPIGTYSVSVEAAGFSKMSSAQ